MSEMDNDKGLIYIHTGNGKGKTTAAFGLALRSLGYGHKVFIAQFMKGQESGEYLAAQKFLPDLTLYKCGRNSFVNKNCPAQIDAQLAQMGLEVSEEAILSGQYDMVILDEINVAVNFNLVSKKAVMDLIKKKPKNLNLVLTGRYAAQEFIDLADLVTEMKEIKHPYVQGITAKQGLEF